MDEFLMSNGIGHRQLNEEVEGSPLSKSKCLSTNTKDDIDMHNEDQNVIGRKTLVEPEEPCFKYNLPPTPMETPEDLNGEMIDTEDVQGGVYAQVDLNDDMFNHSIVGPMVVSMFRP